MCAVQAVIRLTICPLTIGFFFIGLVLQMVFYVSLPLELERHDEDMKNFKGTKICTLSKTSPNLKPCLNFDLGCVAHI